MQGLSEVEQMLISPVIPLMSIYRLPHGQYGYSGHVINLPQDVPSFVMQLPRLPSNLDIVIVRKEGSHSHHDFCVRRSKVLTALQWLITNNIYFSDITINYENLLTLPENDHLTNIPTISVSSDPTDADLPTGPIQDQCDPDVCRTFVPIIPETNTEQQNISNSLQSTTVTWPARGQNPLNEFQCEGYITRAFPVLFPTGKAEFLAPRLNSVTIGAYFKHLMLYHDGRFAKHCRFRYFALNTEMRWRALQSGQVYVRHNPEDGQLTLEDLQSMMANEGENFSNRVLRYAASLRGTRQYWMQQRTRLIAMVDTLGLPTIFFTHSAADLHWPELSHLYGEQNVRQSGALIENPALADWFFYHRFQKFIEVYYSGILGAYDFWYRFEWQHRGSPHVHGVAWLRNAPNVEQSLEDGNTSRRQLINFIDSLVCTHNPAVLPDGSNLDNAPNASINPHVCSRPYSDIGDYNADLIELVSTCQRHTRCSTSYCLRTKQGQQQCRFGYPKPLQGDTTIVHVDGVCELLTKRNDPLVNSYNPIQLSAWRANVDMQYLISKEKVVEYCAKYATKCEPRSEPMRQTFHTIVNSLKEGNSSVTAVQKLLINTIGERDYSAQETCHLLLQLPMFKASRDFVVLSLDGSHLVQNVQDGQISTAPSILDHYIHRPITFDELNLLTFAKTYIMPKDPSTEPRCRRKDVIVIIRPYCSPDSNGPNFEQYCQQKLMLYVKFRQLSDLLKDSSTFTEAYQQFLLSADVPPSLEEDIRRIEAECHTEEEEQEVLFIRIKCCTIAFL